VKSHDVRFWEIRPNKSMKNGKPVTRSYTVRWTVAGREKSKTFERKPLATRHLAKLVRAADQGEGFDTDTGLPDSMARERSSLTWYQHACEYADERWNGLSAKGRISLVEGLMAVTVVLVKSRRGAPEPEVLRRALRRWAFNPPRRDTEMPDDVTAALRWLAKSSMPVTALEEVEPVTKALNACASKLDGETAAAEYYRASVADLLWRGEIRDSPETSFGKPPR
jgi:hypothetical protein